MSKDKSTGKKLADMMYGNPEGAAFGIYPKAGKRSEDKQDREAAKNFPVDLARGLTAGFLGMPADILNFPGAIYSAVTDKDSYKIPYGSEDILKSLPLGSDTPTGQFASGLGTLIGGSANIGPAIRGVKALPGALKTAARNVSTPRTLDPQAGVIKMKGGNWLGGSVEGALKGLKRPMNPDEVAGVEAHLAKIEPHYDLRDPRQARELADMRAHIQALKQAEAINNWVDRNLGNYVKKEMATPEDPVRRLAEEGITHLPQNEIDFHTQWIPEDLALSRMKAGFPTEGMGQSNTAKGWEAITDSYIHSAPASEYTKPLTESEVRRGFGSVVGDNPWLSKLDPDTPVQYIKSADSIAQDLRLDHIVDVLREDLTSGRIRPEQLSKVSMEQAVRRTAEYDQEMAKKMADAKAAAREGLPVYKEYPEGYRWVELNRPGAFASESEAMGHSVRGYEPPQGHPDWVAGSGDRGSLGYGHGGWEAIKSGKAKVYSLVDEKGQPHVTVEVGRPELKFGMTAGDIDPYRERLRQQFPNLNDEELYYKAVDEFTKDQTANLPPRITQIKGKQNAAPNPEYLPYVQDFVKSGQWSDVGDIQNTGLRNVSNWVNPDTAKEYEKFNLSVPKYATDEELDALHRQYEGLSNPGDGMARGGPVHFSDNPDVMALELQAGGAVRMQVGGIPKRVIDAGAKAIKALKPAKVEKEPAVPLTLPRVRPTTKDIMEAAERVGKQQAGEFVRSPLLKDTTNLAGRSKREFDRLKKLDYKVTPIKDLPEMKPYEAKIGEVNIALPGDQTISDMLVESVDDMPIGVISEGGANFGRGRLSDPEETRAFWASNIGPAGSFQRKVTELARLYDTDMVTAYHLAMGQTSNNFAQHLAEANMKAIDYSKLDKSKMNRFDSEIAAGTFKTDKKTGERIYTTFPEWPGIANPEEALEAMKKDPELRKWFNDRMKTLKSTKPSDLPNAKSIEYAMTEPDIRDLEINMTGLSAGRMKPGAELIPDSAHQTYSHDIPGTALGRAPELSPFSISFPDATAFVRENYRAPDFTGTIQKVFPHQVVDEAYLEDMYKYYTQLRKVRGFNEGGSVNKAEGGEITADDLILEERKL
jgi:hypothetical protein